MPETTPEAAVDDRTCSVCGETKPVTDFYRYSGRQGRQGGYMRRCKRCQVRQSSELRKARYTLEQRAASQREYNRRRPDHVKLANRIKSRYGLTIDEWQALLDSQGQSCAVCRLHIDELPDDGRNTKMHVDHCHDTGRVRGLLCSACNRALGCFRDDPHAMRAAANYVESSGVPLASENQWIAARFLNKDWTRSPRTT